MKTNFFSFVAGVVFAIGLVVGGMVDTRNVVGFLDIAGSWDPRLLFVMGGAIGVFLPGYQLFRARSLGAAMEERYQLPKLPVRDPRLVLGAVLFGIGWALVGYCPGPAVVALGAAATGRGAVQAVTFVLAMLVGMGLHKVFATQTKDAPAEGVDA